MKGIKSFFRWWFKPLDRLKRKPEPLRVIVIPENSFFRVIERAFGKAEISIWEYHDSAEQERFIISIDNARFGIRYFKEESLSIEDRVECHDAECYQWRGLTYAIESLLVKQMQIDGFTQK